MWWQGPLHLVMVTGSAVRNSWLVEHDEAADRMDDGIWVTLVYEDLPSTSSGGVAMLHHDLALEVVAPNRKHYWGNHGLCNENESLEGGSNDPHNPVENVFLTRETVADAGTGNWLVRVHAPTVIPLYDESSSAARFSLVISGLVNPRRVR